MSRVEHATRSSRIGVALIAMALVVLTLAPFWGDGYGGHHGRH